MQKHPKQTPQAKTLAPTNRMEIASETRSYKKKEWKSRVKLAPTRRKEEGKLYQF